jgi:hypothetical protein
VSFGADGVTECPPQRRADSQPGGEHRVGQQPSDARGLFGVALDEHQRNRARGLLLAQGDPHRLAVRRYPRQVDHHGIRGILAQGAETGAVSLIGEAGGLEAFAAQAFGARGSFRGVPVDDQDARHCYTPLWTAPLAGDQAAADLVHDVGSQKRLPQHREIVLLAERFFLRRQNGSGHHDDQHLRHGLQELDAQLDAVAVGQHVIQQGGVGLVLPHQALGFGGRFGGEQGPAGIGHQALQKAQQVAVVVHQQHGGVRGGGGRVGFQRERKFSFSRPRPLPPARCAGVDLVGGHQGGQRLREVAVDGAVQLARAVLRAGALSSRNWRASKPAPRG